MNERQVRALKKAVQDLSETLAEKISQDESNIYINLFNSGLVIDGKKAVLQILNQIRSK